MTNRVSTSKYNALNFFPVTLLLQFQKITNLFYLACAIIQFFPQVNSSNPLATIIPLAFVVGLGMLREILADLKRWSLDRKSNNRLYESFMGKQRQAAEFRVGDIIELR